MTDEPREENRPEEEDVEGHGALGNLERPLREKLQADEDDDVEAHAPLARPLGEPPIGP
jgi:hypothetical protein